MIPDGFQDRINETNKTMADGRRPRLRHDIVRILYGER